MNPPALVEKLNEMTKLLAQTHDKYQELKQFKTDLETKHEKAASELKSKMTSTLDMLVVNKKTKGNK